MEVLQTSALPLGDGAGRNRIVRGIRPRQMMRQQQRDVRGWMVNIRRTQSRAGFTTAFSGPPSPLRGYGATTFALGLPTEAHAPVGKRERRLERETGFEPATSTLARSHSTTELFPLTQHGPAPLRRRT